MAFFGVAIYYIKMPNNPHALIGLLHTWIVFKGVLFYYKLTCYKRFHNDIYTLHN